MIFVSVPSPPDSLSFSRLPAEVFLGLIELKGLGDWPLEVGYFNDFESFLLYFLDFAALSHIWYCQGLRTFGGKFVCLKFG